jgi:diphthine-ammonia ligase
VATGTRALVTSVACGSLDVTLLGRELDDAVFGEIAAAGADPFGERGEYHTLVVDAPLFSHPLPAPSSGRYRHGGYWYLDLGARPPGA